MEIAIDRVMDSVLKLISLYLSIHRPVVCLAKQSMILVGSLVTPYTEETAIGQKSLPLAE